MIKLKNIFLLLAAGLSVLGSQKAQALTISNESLMKSGKWVKIGVPSNGVYELTYEQLRNLGFSNPSAVKIWGDGGVMYPANFVDQATGERLIPDVINQVSVWHNNNKLYFYGRGPENVAWRYENTFSIPGRMANNGLNIYSNLGYYFLTDIGENKAVTATTYTGDKENTLDYGYSYFLHERDLTQGASNSGQTFWGENFLPEGSRTQSFEYKAPMPKHGMGAIFNVIFCGSSWLPSTLQIKIDDKELGETTMPARRDEYVVVCRNIKQTFEMETPAESGTVTMTWGAPNCDKLQALLDYFMFTYARELKFAPQETQFGVQATTNDAAALKMPEGNDVICWDISQETAPQALTAQDGLVMIPAGTRSLSFFKTSAAQPSPQIIGEIANNDIRGKLWSANPEMVIITTGPFRMRAEQLADFHRIHDGASVSVVTVDEIYNEFSSGRPDPMAYRTMLRMLHNRNGSKLRALLLYGPQYSNVRVDGSTQPREAIITYQYAEADGIIDCIGLTDLYGIFADYVPKYISTMQMNIAVASMPVLSDAEAERYYNKVVRYTFDDSRAYWMERMMFLADDANINAHANQSEFLAAKVDELTDSSMVSEKVYFSEYGYPAVKQPLYNSMSQGVSNAIYIGHGSPTQLGQKKALLTPSDIGHFRNKRLSFMAFASCETSLYELGARGISEHMVLSANDGLVGMIGTTRIALIGNNFAYMRNYVEMMHKLTNVNTGQPAELGEIVRRSKNSLTGVQGKYIFQLLSDPLLRMYLPTLKGTLTKQPAIVTPGETAEFEGRFSTPSGYTVDDFNGQLVLKWYSPEYTALTGSKVAADPLKDFYVTYNSDVVALQAYDVKDGRFKFTTQVPDVMRQYAGDTIKLTITAYDVNNRIGGAIKLNVAIDADSYSVPSADTEAPVINDFRAEGAAEGNYLLPSDVTLLIEATDNNGLRVDEKAFDTPLQLLIDGQIEPTGVADFVTMTDGARRMTIRYPLEKMAPGSHIAEIKITDFAGNTTSAEYAFEIGSGASNAAPQLAETACRSQATLSLDAAVMAEATNPILVITDAIGKEVVTGSWSGAEFKWNLTNASGQRVAPGLYKAYVRYIDSKGRSAVTNPAYVPVLKNL